MNVQDRETYPADFPWDGSFRTDDVQRLPWWPYRPLPGRVDALWLLGEDASVEGTFGRLVEGWGSSSAWFAAGSSLHAPGSEPASWTRAHPDLAVELVGRMTLEGAGPFARSTEWWRLRPTATGLLGLLQGPLLHPRQGWWLAAAPDPEAGPRFLRATTGLLWWSTRDYRPHEGRTHEVVDDSVKEALLGLLPRIEVGQAEVWLDAGETLLLYTDGITEATVPRGRQLGIDAVHALFARAPAHGAQELVDTIAEGVLEQAQDIRDDLALLALHVPAEPAS